VLNRKLTLDLQTMETRFSDGVRYADCEVCGELSLELAGAAQDPVAVA
jgi:hypothetical protein